MTPFASRDFDLTTELPYGLTQILPDIFGKVVFRVAVIEFQVMSTEPVIVSLSQRLTCDNISEFLSHFYSLDLIRHFFCFKNRYLYLRHRRPSSHVFPPSSINLCHLRFYFCSDEAFHTPMFASKVRLFLVVSSKCLQHTTSLYA